jgi:hypothetical protein
MIATTSAAVFTCHLTVMFLLTSFDHAPIGRWRDMTVRRAKRA